MARGRSIAIKILIFVAVIAGIGFLFVRSANQTRSEPYTVQRRQLANWTVSTELSIDSNGAVLALRPQPELAPALFRDVFSRMMESLTAPTPAAMPLLLQSEFAKAFEGRVTMEAVVSAARQAGLESQAVEPLCMASRRISEPGSTRQVHFLLFDAPAFVRFRQQLLAMATAAGAGASDFDPLAMSPIVIIAASDTAFSRWLPLRADATRDCVAPIEVR